MVHLHTRNLLQRHIPVVLRCAEFRMVMIPFLMVLSLAFTTMEPRIDRIQVLLPDSFGFIIDGKFFCHIHFRRSFERNAGVHHNGGSSGVFPLVKRILHLNYWIWLHYISLFKYSYEAVLHSEFNRSWRRFARVIGFRKYDGCDG